MAKLTLGKTVASVLVSSALALSVAIGVTAGQAYKKNSDESSYDGDRKDNPFENVNVQNVEKVADYGLISEYKIAFDDGTSSTFIVINGQNGPETIQAFPNDDGYTPKVSVGEDGKWIINEKETGLVADITNILEEIGPHIGENGNWWIGDVDTGTNAQGQPGTSPHVGENGNWYIGDTDTGVQAQGQNGKSAYELMQEQGYTGTFEEWVQTLKGQDGQDGKSAYEIMQEAGYIGTLEEWLDSLKGQDGKSAYELMQEAGYTGTLEEWLASLKGEDGKSAYELAVENGYTGTVEEWLLSLVGKDGKSAYEIMQEQGYTGTMSEWLESLAGEDGQDGQDGKSAYQIYCDLHDGDDLNEADWLASLIGNGIESITGPVTDGLFDTYTINYSNGGIFQFAVRNGQDGRDGSITLFGAVDPLDDEGANGDSFINTATWDYFVKENGAWAQKGNIRGASGADGKSAFEVMQEQGYTGTITEWLESLKGEKGDKGDDGKSAYEIMQEQGYTGTMSEWLDSLVGEDGQDGKSAYELAVENGFTGTEAEWLESLVGQDGQDGKSAYQIYCDLHDGDDLNEADWLASLVGQNGENGTSIYGVAGAPAADFGNVGDSYVNVTNGDYYVKTDTGWGDPIGSLKGADGATGNGISSIELSDDTDPRKSVYTITYTDASTETFEIAKPRSIVSIERTSGDGSAGSTDTYTITYNYGDPDTFTVTHGSNGNTILTGDTAPANSLGRPGDVYVDYVNQDIYLKGIDDWSVGISFRGEDGRGIASIEKSGPEADGLTYTYTITYTDASTPFVFTVTNGADGADGTKVVTGSELPTVLTNFQEGDSFINTSNWNYYVLQDNAGTLEWDYRGNIRGTGLFTGHLGDNAPVVESTYKEGDSYLNLDNWDYYVLRDNAGTLEWQLEGNIHNSPFEYEITFNSNGGSDVDSITDAKEGHTIAKPATDPTKDGYFFQGWYTVEGNRWDFSKDVVTQDTTLYAHWAQFEVTNGVLTGCTATGDIIIPEYFDGQYITSIQDDLFRNKTGITSIALPNTVREIPDSAFEGCTDLLSFVMTNNVVTIGENAFKNCTNLKFVYLSESLSEIGAHAFEDCTSLKGIHFPDGLETIGDYAFAGCTSLLAINFNDNLTNIGDYAFKNIGGTGWSEKRMRYGHGDPILTPESQNGDFYIDVNTGELYIRQNDIWRKGKITVTVTSLGTWLEDDEGNDGDFWADEYQTNTYNMYVKLNGRWEEANMTCYLGHGAPTIVNNRNGYWYIDLDTEDLYVSCDGVWEKGKLAPIVVGNETYYDYYEDDSHSYNEDCEYYIDTTFSEDIGWSSSSGKTSLTFIASSGEGMGSGAWYLRVLPGHGVPVAQEGDKYIDLDSGSIYEYDGYYWDYASSVVVASGHGAPASGAIDTYYFDLDSSKLYYKDGKCLSSITFPDNLQTIGLGAFEGCNGLETITLPFVGGSIKNKGESTDFDTYYTVFGHIFGTDYDYEQNDYVPASLKKVVVTKGNQFSGYDEWEETTMNDCRIPHGAFKNCANIETIVIPETVTYIGTTAFKDCAALKNIIFEGQTRIRSFQDNTFSGCSSLESFVTPASVEYIKHGSFSNCTSLKYFTYEENSKINSLYPGVFAGCSSLESYIEPDSCVDNIYYICTDGNPIFDGCTSMKNMVIKGEFFVSTNNPSHLPYDMNATNRNPTSSDRGHDGHYWLNTSTYDLYMYYGPRVGGSWQYVGSIKTSNSCTVHVNNATNPVDGDVLIFVEGGKTTHPYYQIRKNGQWVNKNYRIIGFGWLFGDSSNATLPDSLKSVTIGGNRAIDYKFFAYAQSIENIVLKDTVTSISEESFSGCYSLVSVTLSNSITSIPSNAFDYCYSLESIVIPDGVTSIGEEAFTDCTSLESIVIPDSVISIGDSAFEDCDSLKYVKLSDNLASLGMSAFYSCDSLESITIPGTLTSIGGNAFADIMALKTVVISDGVTSIGSSAFYWCTNLEYVITPDTLESIGAGAFSGCIALKSFVIPDGATDIGRGAFMDCTSLQSIVVPNSVTSIGEKVFEGTDLESLTIPFITTLDNILRYNDTLKTLEITGDGTFSTGVFAGSYCPIETLIISGNQTIEPGAFSQIGYVDSENHLEKIVLRNVSPTSSTYFYNYFGSYASAVPSTLKTVEILEGITSIKEKAFYNCNNLETIVIPEDVYDIANSAFENCSSLVNLKLPSGVETISSRTFYGCTSLTGLNLNNVTDVGSYSFYNCSALKDVDLRNITNIYEHAFEGCASLEKAILSNNLESIGASAFKGCSSLVFVNGGADSYCHIEDETFKDCESLSYVYIKNMGDIGNSAFSGCHALRNIIFDDGAYEIGDSAFAYCKSLASIVLPESLFKIGDNAFMSCEGLASIIIPEQVHSIGDSAFKGCKSLKNLIIPKDLDDIGEGALEDCDSLESLSVPNLFTSSSSFYMSQLFNGVPQSLKTVTFTGYHDLDNYVTSALGSVETLIINVGGEIGDDAFENCTGLRRVVIGVDVTMIGASAFRDCSNLESINFPSSIQTIRSHAFEGCKKLERVNLVSVETIEDSAFYNCTSLIYVNLGNRLENISDYTFMGCSSLSQVIIPDCLEEIGKSAFSNCYSLTLFNFKDVEKIGNAAFYKCSSLMTISLNITKLTTIGADAFTSCTSISTIIVRGATGANYAAKVTSYQTWYNNYGGGNIMLQYNEESGVNLIFRY